MLLNPFTPSHIASLPEDFFGRGEEIQTMERSLAKGSVAIQGAIGIGKSSLLARVGLIMEGFASHHKSRTVIITGNKDIATIDDVARIVLEEFVDVDEQQNKVKMNLGKVFEIESSEICRYFKEKRHLSMLNKIIERDVLPPSELLLLMVDEADKCPIPLAKFIRSVVTHTQHRGINNVRFVVAGVNPYFEKMVEEDPGISRFFYKMIGLLPMHDEDAEDLVNTKLRMVVQDAEQNGISLAIDSDVTETIVRLSGGHPHLLQLLGSHLLEHESQQPDGLLDRKDLINSLRTICYEDRARVYESAIHALDLDFKLDSFRSLLLIASSKCPTRIDRDSALDLVGKDDLAWFVDRNFLTVISPDLYGLTDEFLRVRLFMDEEFNESEAAARERQLIEHARFRLEEEEWREGWDEGSEDKFD